MRAHSRRWTHTDELLALILERLDRLRIVTEHVWTDEKHRPARMPTAQRYPRPVPPPKPKPATAADVQAFFSGKHPLRHGRNARR